MPNGGHVCCEYCAYNRSQPGKCDIFGIDTNVFTLCRTFRMARQSHQEARKQWPMLEKLEPGLVYQIDNNAHSAGNPRPVYKVIRIKPTAKTLD
jgi:hypothetical protein